MATLNIALTNNSESSRVFAHITGRAIDQNSSLFLLQADGNTPYYPASPSGVQQALAADCNIVLGPPGTTRVVTVPRIAGGRIWFSIDEPLIFALNPGPGLVEPSVSNESDPNFNKNWGFCEFTFNDFQLFANISYVDFVSLPIAMTLQGHDGQPQHVTGINPEGLNVVCDALRAQAAKDGAGWDKLIVQANGQNLRALSPNTGNAINGLLFDRYFDSYVDRCWEIYRHRDLLIDTQAQWGVVKGRVVDDRLTFPGIGSFSRPSSRDIFSCSTGPFADYQENRIVMGALTARISAALNRSVLHIDCVHPTEEKIEQYYSESPANHYSRIVHDSNPDRRGYAFPYDDVVTGTGGEQAGCVAHSAPKLFTITLGGRR